MATEKSEHPTAQYSVERYIQIADSLSNAEQINEAIKYLQQALKLATPENTKQIALLYNKIGRCESFSGNDNRAIEYFKQAKEYAVLSNDSIALGDSFNNLGISYEYTGKSDSAFYYYEKSLRIREHLKDTNRLSASYRNIAQVLRVLQRLKDATLYCRRAYELIPGIDNYKVIANIYNELAYLYELNNQLDSAEYFYIQLIEIAKKNEFSRGVSVGYSNLASVYEREKNYHDALWLKKKSLQIDKGINDIYGVMTSYRSIAECYLLLEDYYNTLKYLDSATIICDSSWVPDLYGIETLKYETYSGLKNYQSALLHYEKAIELKDSLFNERKRKNIAEILTKYENEKKEQQIIILNQTNQLKSERIIIQWIILSAIILISITGAFISLLIIKNKNHRINHMSLELRNYMLQHDDFKDLKTEPNEEDKNDPLKILTEEFELTQREIEILILISQGLTNDELGEKLFISRNTIKYHIKNIYIKLDVRNRVQALQKAALNSLSTLA
jgi:DNA-binding CsgD family transcriptional regulator